MKCKLSDSIRRVCILLEKGENEKMQDNMTMYVLKVYKTVKYGLFSSLRNNKRYTSKFLLVYYFTSTFLFFGYFFNKKREFGKTVKTGQCNTP